MNSGHRRVARVAAPSRLAAGTLLLATVALLAYLSPRLGEALQYESAAVAGGQYWRLFTGHLAHWDASHLAWDLLTFVVLGWLAERLDRRRFWWCLAASSLAISAALWIAHPQVQRYRGLSGVDVALFVLVTAGTLGRDASARGPLATLVAWSLLTGLALKLVYESASGQALFVHSPPGITPLPLAHIVGAVAGLLCVRPAVESRRAVEQVSRRAEMKLDN